jgi:hypothetical protein
MEKQMALEMSPMRSERYINNTVLELKQANHSPIYGYQNLPLMTLEEAVEKIVPFVDRTAKYVHDAKQKCNRDLNILTWDESAAIYLYTMSTPFFSKFNDMLREEKRDSLKPWFAFLKLFMSALEKLPSLAGTVWRAASSDVGSFSLDDDSKTWWSVNSCSIATDVVELYLGEMGTLFAITTIHGKNISEYSAYPEEQEVILMPGIRLCLKSKSLNYNRLMIVHLEEEPKTEQETPK